VEAVPVDQSQRVPEKPVRCGLDDERVVEPTREEVVARMEVVVFEGKKMGEGEGEVNEDEKK
jgi:hypothetical protein